MILGSIDGLAIASGNESPVRSKKLAEIQLAHENGKVTVRLYYWDNSKTVLNMTQEDFLQRLGVNA
jgi:hypothetical protein